MKSYDYKCKECKKIHELEWEFGKDLPKKIDCPLCGAKESSNYDVFQITKSSTYIPDHMKAVNGERMNFNKMHRDQKVQF